VQSNRRKGQVDFIVNQLPEAESNQQTSNMSAQLIQVVKHSPIHRHMRLFMSCNLTLRTHH